jgi:Flp pilus assembly protein TadD
MRFAEWLRRACAAGALGAALGGCAGVSGPRPAQPPPAQAAAAAASARAKETPSGISPEVQQEFDGALDALNAGHTEEAMRTFLALTVSHADLGGPHANLGMIYRRAGKADEAVAELELAVKLNPQQPVFLNQLGIAYRQQGKFAKAREAYEKAIALDPSYAAPYLNLGILFDLYFWDSKRALEFYDRYLALTPGGDERVVKWVADIKNRRQQGGKLSRGEQP